MSTKTEKDKVKQIQDKCQALLNEMLRDEDNKYCVDCDSKGPRWASWNLGVFLCIRCAGIHRNLGVHISKVKSVNLDAWTPEQVVSLQQMGNSRARAVYEANLPDNFRRPQSDSSLESFVRAKYEHKKYIAREWVPPVIPKVDWEKEIDEEIERQKRKKKAAAASSSAAIDKKPIKIAEVPQIPKPKNSSPKPTRTIEKTTQDLLGFQNGEDGFTGFLSGPSPVLNETVVKIKKEGDIVAAAEAAAKAEEESFFNQPAPTEKERTKLTKDSILALYASFPPIQNHAMYAPPSGAFPQQPYAFGAFPQQTQPQGFTPAQNGMTPPFQQTATASGPQFQQFAPQNQSTTTPGPQFQAFTSQNQQTTAAACPQFQQFASQNQQTTASGQYQQFANQFPMQPGSPFMVQAPTNTAPLQFAAAGQFAGLGQFPAASTGVQVPSQYAFQPTGNVFGSQPAASSAVGAVPPASNPFFGVSGQPLQQQFAGLTLVSQMPVAAKPTPPVATNLWQ